MGQFKVLRIVHNQVVDSRFQLLGTPLNIFDEGTAGVLTTDVINSKQWKQSIFYWCSKNFCLVLFHEVEVTTLQGHDDGYKSAFSLF